jgi:hypothetical protein
MIKQNDFMQGDREADRVSTLHLHQRSSAPAAERQGRSADVISAIQFAKRLACIIIFK